MQGEPSQATCNSWITGHSTSVAACSVRDYSLQVFLKSFSDFLLSSILSHPTPYYKVLSNSLWTLSSNGSRVCLPTSARDSSFSVETETEPRLIQVSSCHIPWGLQSKLAFVKNVYHDCKAAVFRESFQESLEITSWISITDSYLIVREEQLSINRRFASITDNTTKWQWQDSGSESNKDAGKSSGSKSHSSLTQVSVYQLFQICSWNINRGASWCNPDVCASGKYSRAVGLPLALDSCSVSVVPTAHFLQLPT